MLDNKNQESIDSVLRIGIVNSVEGGTVKVLVDRNKNNSHLIFKGSLIKNVSVGGYIKILKGFNAIIGQVETEYIEHEKNISAPQYSSQEESVRRYLIVKLLGHFEKNNFKRGLVELPLIDNECFLLTNKEFDSIYAFGDNSDSTCDTTMIQVGHLASDTLIPIRLNINKLFASHIGIFGNTGSGKSYTLSKIYRQLFVKFKDNPIFNQKSHFLFFDFNGEYSSAKAITDNKKVYNLSTNKKEGQDKIPFSESDLLDLDLLCIFANATEKTQRPFINRSIHLYKVFQTPKGLDKEKWLTCKVPCLSYPKIL